MKKSIFLSLGILCSALAFGQQQLQKTPPAETDRLEEILKYVDKMYVDNVDDKKLVDAAIVAMLEKLDPHTAYISKEEVDDANQRIEGSFVGIGIRFQILKDTLMVVETITGGPSEKLGIRAGDKITTIDGVNIAGVGLKNAQVREKLMGELGTKVKIEVKRKNTKNPVTFVITRDHIPVNSVECSYMVEPGIGYIKLTAFARTTPDEMTKALKQLKSEGMQSLILDLQDNGGGLMYVAQYLADEFLSGNKMVVYSEGRAQPRQELKAERNGLWEKGNLVILTDESTASASEIVSGAIQDWDRGVIVGRRSYGKGLVQRPIDLSDGAQLRLTIARYFTPTGRWIQKPYDDLEAYKNDYMKRFMNGEMTHLDSIKLPDSLKFQTLVSKRTVYGGGGIMPDFFVPLDTSEITDFYRDVAGTGVFASYPLTYVDKNRDELNKKYETLNDFIKNFTVDQKMMDEFFAEAMKENKELKMNEEQYKTSGDLMRLRLKAHIAQDLFGSESFYRIYNTKNEILMKAIDVLKSNDYNSIKLASN